MPRCFTVAMRSKVLAVNKKRKRHVDSVGAAKVYRVEFYSKRLNAAGAQAIAFARSMVRLVFKEMHAREDCLLEVTGGKRGVRCAGTPEELESLAKGMASEDVRTACDAVARWMRVKRDRKWTTTSEALESLVTIVTNLRDELVPNAGGAKQNMAESTVAHVPISAAAAAVEEEEESDEDWGMNILLGDMLTHSETTDFAASYGEYGLRYLNVGVTSDPNPDVMTLPFTPPVSPSDTSNTTVNAAIRFLRSPNDSSWIDSSDFMTLDEGSDEAMRHFTA